MYAFSSVLLKSTFYPPLILFGATRARPKTACVILSQIHAADMLRVHFKRTHPPTLAFLITGNLGLEMWGPEPGKFFKFPTSLTLPGM